MQNLKNPTPEEAAKWAALEIKEGEELQQLANASTRLDEALRGLQPMSFPPTRIIQPDSIRFARRNAPSRRPYITTAQLLIAAGMAYAVSEAMIAYDSFTDTEKAKAGKAKLALLVALRTGKNILSRPAQLIALPSKLVAALEKKVAQSN